MEKAFAVMLGLLPFLFTCKAAKVSSLQMDKVPIESFAIKCQKADPKTEIGLTYKTLLEVISAKDCQDAETKLQSLTFLVMNEKNIQDLTPLADLQQLQWLHLYGNRIDDIAPLRGLVKLKGLVLDKNQVQDISALTSLSLLQELYLSHNKVTRIDAIASLKKLYILNLANNQISDLRSLSGLSGLMVLDLKNNAIAEKKSSESCPTSDDVSQALRDFCNQ
jgi:Leucine-rich repeat (LRR) protein